MRKLNLYLNFGGRCTEALSFYKKVFEGEISGVMTYADSPIPDLPEEHRQLVMHAEFQAKGVYFMASDGRPGNPVVAGNTVSLSLNLTDSEEQSRLFEALAQEGQVLMPLSDTFWGARFGMLNDPFGIQWMLNCQTGTTDN